MEKALKVLMIEDNPLDVTIVKDIISKEGFAWDLTLANNGEIALRALKNEGEFTGMERPELIILDIKLPRINGNELLGFIKSDKSLSLIPAVVLTSSDSEKDRQAALDMGAKFVFTKPMEINGYTEIITEIARLAR